ncbi:MAG: uroporphyrin-III C-methyltransferase, partial [Staphylococcus simulans]|nr:uroporphyrin-III C-methyltransferase [Staphylococcus simulans]
GVSRLPEICRLLVQHGRPKDTPAALVYQGTSGVQQTAVGTLETIVDVAKDFKNPSMIVIGEVVQLREKISWFESVSAQAAAHQ